MYRIRAQCRTDEAAVLWLLHDMMLVDWWNALDKYDMTNQVWMRVYSVTVLSDFCYIDFNCLHDCILVKVIILSGKGLGSQD